MMEDVRIGLIGAGRIAQAAHLPALAKAEGARLVAVCDQSAQLAEGVGRRYDVPSYTGTEALLSDPEVDAVIVAVPDRFHLSVGEQALRAGRHVLVEKPIAGTLSDAEALEKAVAETGLLLQVGAMKRYDPGVRFAAEAVRSRIGRVTSANVWYRVMSALRPPIEATLFPSMIVDEEVRRIEATFKEDRASYLLVTHGAHVLDGIRFLLGDPVDVQARAASTGRDYAWHGTSRLSEGGLAHFEITANVHAEWSEGADIYGERGHVRLRTHFPFTLQASSVEVFDEESRTAERPVFPDGNAYKLQIEAFARAIAGGATITPDAADGVAAVRLIEAVGRSAAGAGATVLL